MGIPLRTAASDWTAASGLDANVVAGRTSSVRRCDAVAGRIEVCNSAYGNNGWLGITQVCTSGSHLTQGTVKMNDTYFNT